MPDLRLQPSPGAAVTTLTRQLAPHLAEGELVLGSVRPVARHAWTAVGIADTDSRWARALQMLALIAGSLALLLAGLAMAAVTALLGLAGSEAGALLLALPALAAIAVGTYGMARPWLFVRAASNSQCVLTSHAALMIENIAQDTPQVHRFELTSLQPVSACRVRADGVGDIVLAAELKTSTRGRAKTPDGGFFAVPDARQLAVQIEATRRVRSRRAEREIMTAMQDDYQGYLRRSGQL